MRLRLEGLQCSVCVDGAVDLRPFDALAFFGRIWGSAVPMRMGDAQAPFICASSLHKDAYVGRIELEQPACRLTRAPRPAQVMGAPANLG